MIVTLGGIIADSRKQHRLSQAELAKRVGLSRTYVSMIERNETNVSLNVLCRLSEALRVDIGILANAYQAHRQPTQTKT